MKRTFAKRTAVLYLAVAVVFVVAALRLFTWQVVDGDHYRELADTTASDTYTYTAARGEIVDRYGRPLATNRVGYNVSLNRSYLKDENINATLLWLTDILTASEESWSDTTPMSTTAPFSFYEGQDDAVAALRENLGLNVYATAQNVLDRMVERYELEGYTPAQQRLLGGIRYEMEQREYGYSNPFTLATDVSIKTVTTIKENSASLLGVDIVEESMRDYPDGTIAPHLLGIVGPIYREEYAQLKDEGYQMNAILGKSGLERALESDLRGTDGLIQVNRSAAGEILSQETLEEPVPGKTVVLTLDRDLQLATQQSLERFVTTRKTSTTNLGGRYTEAASAVVLDIKTGGILAAANYPSYNLNDYSTNYNQYLTAAGNPLFNRALQGTYRPGSSFKCAVATAGLMVGEINAGTPVTCTQYYQYWASTGWTPSCTGRHGAINVVRALGVSCNIFFYDVGRRIGLEAFNNVAADYGLGQATGIELPESLGSLTTREDREERGVWQEGDVIQAAIGQQDTMLTPLQMAVYAATIANRGERYAAHLVQEVRSYDYTQTYSQTQPTVLSTVDAEDWVFETVESGMIDATRNSPYNSALKDYSITVASKTGTAQAGYMNGEDVYNSVIIAYGPVENPEIAVAVVVEKGGSGYLVAEVVRDIFNAYYASSDTALQLDPAGQLLG